MNYRPYLNAANTPNRKMRKSSRSVIFIANRKANDVRKKAARIARRIVE